MEICEVFSRFQLNRLPNVWVKNIWEKSFTEASDLPAEYASYLEEIEIGNVLSCACQYIKDWLTTPDQINLKGKHISNVVKETKTWKVLIECEIPHKALLCLLSLLIQNGKGYTKKEETRQIRLKATSLYFMLLSIPGSHVFEIFNSALYSYAIGTLQMCNLIPSGRSSKSKAKTKLRQKPNDSSDLDELSNTEDDHLGANEKNMFIQILNLLLSDLIFFLQRYQLKSERDSLTITMQSLILVTRLETKSPSIVLNSPPENTVSALAHKAYVALTMLCSKEHGDVEEIVKLMTKELFPWLLVTNKQGLQHTGKEAVVIKNHSIDFIHNLVTKIKEPTYLGVNILIQQLCLRSPVRSEIRSKNVQIIIDLIEPLPQQLYSKIALWFMGLSHNEQVNNRITGLELVYKVLFLKKGPNKSPLPQSKEERCSTPKFLLGTILSRCKDVSPPVKAKALALFANAIKSDNIYIKKEIETIFIIPYIKSPTIKNSNIRETGFFDMHKFILNKDYESNKHVNPLSGGKAVISCIKSCIKDENILVRKEGLRVLSNILLLSEKWISNDLLQLMIYSCKDVSLSIRKLMIQCFTEILTKYPTHQKLPWYWVQGVLPLLADQELISQKKVFQALQTTVFDNICAYDKMCKPSHSIPWNIVPLLIKENMQKEFSFACYNWVANNNRISQKIIRMLKTHVGTENNLSAWYMLSSLSQFIDIKETRFIMDYFYQNVYNELIFEINVTNDFDVELIENLGPERMRQDRLNILSDLLVARYRLSKEGVVELVCKIVDELCFQLVTETLYLNILHFSEKNKKRIKEDLLRALKNFLVPITVIARYMDMVQLITEKDITPPKDARAHMEKWAGIIIEIAQKKLLQTSTADCPHEFEDEVMLIRLIFSLGEAASICPNRLSHETIILIKNLLEAKHKGDKGVIRWKGKVSPHVQAVSITTLGKLCLQNQETAKELVPYFAYIMSTTNHPEIKINSMIALSDLCIRFTSLVEVYLIDMCICLRDDNVEVRDNTLTMLLQLLQEEYLKLHCPLFFHILNMINDESPKICFKAKSFIVKSEAKHNNILLRHFVECLFHYNGYNNHPTFSKSRMSDRERAVFSLSGPYKLEQRRNIYKFILEHMSDVQRFRTFNALVHDVLDEVLEGEIMVNGIGKPLLQDVFYILGSEDIKLSSMKPRIHDNDEDKIENENKVQLFTKFARQTVATELYKTNVIENILPTFKQLRQKLTTMKSSLVKDLMLCLNNMMKQYRNEINELLAEDPELSAEIEFDLKNCTEDEDNIHDDTGYEPEDQIIMKNVVFNAIIHSKELKGSELQTVMTESIKKKKNFDPVPLNLPTPACLNFYDYPELASISKMIVSLSKHGPSYEDMDVALSPQPCTSKSSNLSVPSNLNSEPEPEPFYEDMDVALSPQQGTSKSSNLSVPRNLNSEPEPEPFYEDMDVALSPQQGTSKSSNLSVPRNLNSEPEPEPSYEDMDVALSPQPGTPKSSNLSVSRNLNSEPETEPSYEDMDVALSPQPGTSKSSNLSVPRNLNSEPESSPSSTVTSTFSWSPKTPRRRSMAKNLNPKSYTP